MPYSIESRYNQDLKNQNRILENRIEKLEKILVSRVISKEIAKPIIENLTNEYVNKQLDENLYEPISKGIAFTSGLIAITSFVFVSVILSIPLAAFSGFFCYIYLKLHNKRKSILKTYYSSKKDSILESPQFG